MSTDDRAGCPTRRQQPFFSPSWFDMALGELDALLRDEPLAQAWSFSLIERFENAPAFHLTEPYERAGLRLDIVGGIARLKRGIKEHERASIMIWTQWTDAVRASQMLLGEDYARFGAWRASTGRYRIQGNIEPKVAKLLASMHDRVALRTSPPTAEL